MSPYMTVFHVQRNRNRTQMQSAGPQEPLTWTKAITLLGG